jgi:hypothetical protein
VLLRLIWLPSTWYREQYNQNKQKQIKMSSRI